MFLGRGRPDKLCAERIKLTNKINKTTHVISFTKFCAAHKNKTGVHDIFIDKEQQEVETMETISLSVTQLLYTICTEWWSITVS